MSETVETVSIREYFDEKFSHLERLITDLLTRCSRDMAAFDARLRSVEAAAAGHKTLCSYQDTRIQAGQRDWIAISAIVALLMGVAAIVIGVVK